MPQYLLLARVNGARAVYGVHIDDATRPGTILGVTDPLPHPASRRRFLAGALPADPARAAWGQRQRWAFPWLDLREAPVLGNEVAPSTSPTSPAPPTATYRHERVRCGKPTGRRCQTGPGHGPYWYAYWRAGGRLH